MTLCLMRGSCADREERRGNGSVILCLLFIVWPGAEGCYEAAKWSELWLLSWDKPSITVCPALIIGPLIFTVLVLITP